MELYSFLRNLNFFVQSIKSCLVSVSLWSYIHSYTLKLMHYDRETDSYVSVSLWSYIHSYLYDAKHMNVNDMFSFRLLMELYSFLLVLA